MEKNVTGSYVSADGHVVEPAELWSGPWPQAKAIKVRFSRQACSILRDEMRPRAYPNKMTLSRILGS
jgi:hypothetical protein